MKIFLFLTEDPYYTEDLVYNIISRPNSKVVGAVFPSGFINLNRVIKTIFIYGLIKFIRVSIYFLYSEIKGGKVKNLLKKYNIPCRVEHDINNRKFVKYLESLDIDLIISNNCPQLLKKDILDIPQQGSINLHLGKLPRYRGVFPIFYAIINGETHFGVTVHFMNAKFDDGPIINQVILPINTTDDLFDLYPLAFQEGSNLLLKAINMIEKHNLKTHQNKMDGNYYFTYPTFKQVLKYRTRSIKNKFYIVNKWLIKGIRK